MSRSLKIGFIGAGVLGRGLALGLWAAGYWVVGASSRTVASAEGLARLAPGCEVFEDPQDLARACDLVFITTPDDAIGEVARGLEWSPGQGIVHCSGAESLEPLMPATRWGVRPGSFHPFQTLAGVANAEEAVERFKGVTFALEADGWMLETLETMARDLGGRPLRLDSRDRGLYHASAVMGCGYLVTLVEAAAGLWASLGLSREEGFRAVLPLARATLENVASLGPREAATGPIVRGDVKTIEGHLEVISDRCPDILPLYLALARASLPQAAADLSKEKLYRMKALLVASKKEGP